MSQRNMLATVVCAGALVVGVSWSVLHWMGANDAHPVDITPASFVTASGMDSDLREVLRQRESELERLRTEVSRLEALLAQQREVAPTKAKSVEDATQIERPAAQATLAGGGIEAARLLLQKLMPDRFGSLTPDEAASLTKLDLHGSKVTDADLAVISALPALTSISLRGTAVTDAGIGVLADSSLIKAIDLRDTQISGAGLASLPLYKLDALHLTGTKVTGDDMRTLPPMPELRVLKLNRLAVGDDALRDLRYLPALKHLELDGTPITATGVRYALNQNPSIQRIEMRGTAVDQQALAQLHADYPGVEFVSDPPGGPLAGLYR